MAYIPKKKRKSYRPKQDPKFGKDPFYNGTAWRRISEAMREDFVICPVCESTGTQMTDHVVSRSLGGADYDGDNLLPMCHTCHNVKRGLEANTDQPLIETRDSDTEQDKIVPVDKFAIIQVINQSRKKYRLNPPGEGG